MPLIAAVVLSFIPALFYSWILYWLDRYEKEPIWLITGIFLWGAFISTIGAIILSLIFEGGVYLLTGSEELTNVTGTVLIAPLVEESLKGFAVLLVFLLFRGEFDSLLDGVVYAGIVALGFAATENVLYLLGAFGEEGWEGLITLFVLRVILGAWGHAFYTSFIGIGLSIARLNRSVPIKLLAPVAGWLLAVLAHAVHNGMAVFIGSEEGLGLGGLAALLLIDWAGWGLMFAIIAWAIFRERSWLRQYLSEEVERGVLTVEQYRVACSTRAQIAARFRALFRGRRRATRQFYQLCAELAQKKHHLAVLGEEHGNTHTIEHLRGELARLAPNIGIP